MALVMNNLDQWIKETKDHKLYWLNVRRTAAILNSDGCTGVLDIFRDTCLEHDIHYRTHRFLCGCDIDFSTANYIFRRRIQQRSLFGRFSPVSWLRWIAVNHFGRKAWNTHGK